MSAAAFKAVVNFLYEGEAAVVEQPSLTALQEVLAAASRLQVAPLIESSVAALESRLGPESCLGVWDTADRLMLPLLVDAARRASLRHFSAIALGDA
eukprot:5578396-Prymnesium_polylepis.1